jgi:hypothetical protein
MCNPSAIGSRQASSTIWARCRGGNLLRPPQSGVVQQKLLEPALLVATTDSPDGGPVTFRLGGDGLDWFAGSDSQDDTSVLDLKPSQTTVASHSLQDGEIGSGDGHRARFASTHEDTSDARAGTNSSILVRLEFVA